ncbi:hypothetical protein GCM10009584_23050 [Ornithinimicrobium humiphilum]|uniref:Ig-like domain-containing protein n=1 Tax=Ornithinimicrobium humiphilum TaxID=125288 RepID=A0A543KMV0_9MICO|nr:PxKF domain-containing protein [Ornithinimicrobium humiphilum]TQM96402.1 hypothetical protein FB476_1268 [Ornithinimicrobium humiphilum]
MKKISWARRALAVTAATVLGVSTLGGTTALADDIVNNIVAADKTIRLNVDETGQTVLSLVERDEVDGDPEPGCNLQGGQTPDYVSYNVVSSDPAVATVNPSYVRFDKCADTSLLTVTAHQAGTAVFTLADAGWSNVNWPAPKGQGKFVSETATFTVIVTAPNTAPTIRVTGVVDGASYNTGEVPVAMCEWEDAEDGTGSFAAELSAISGPYAVDGIGEQTATCSYTDAGGLTATASATYSIVDPTAPAISYDLTPAVPDGENGWYRSDVSLTWTVSEPESPSSLVTTGCVDQLITEDQQETTYSCSATSAGGSFGPVEVTIKRDATAPEVEFVGGPTGDIYYGDPIPVPTCTATDATSGVNADGCVVTDEPGTSVGPHKFTATATDNAGNTTTEELTYEIKAWTLTGFFKPVDMGVLNTVKGGSTVPLKFRVFAGDREITDVAAVKSFTTRTISCDTSLPVDEVEEIASTGGTVLRYDTEDGQFIQNWKTPKTTGCYEVTMTTQDGSKIKAQFKLR